jgi:hypothetical protein
MTDITRCSARASGLERRAGLVRELLALSEHMLTEAEAAHWKAVIERERQRQRVVWELFVAPFAGEERSRWTRDLERVLAISRRLTELARAEREIVAKDLLKMRQGRRGHRAYTRWTRS